jgi:ATP-dependent Clp protease adaptor protein ClpS
MSQDILTRPKTNTSFKEPPLFKIIYLNDNVTTMGFVVSSLMDHFDYTQETAIHIMQDIHNEGSAVVAVLPYELAEQKGIEVTVSARANDFPLQVKLEPEAQ